MKDSYLSDALEDSGLTSKNMAEILGLNHSTVSRFIGGYSYVSYAHVEDICACAGVRREEFEKHIEMTAGEIKRFGRDDIPVCEYSERRPNAWRALEKERQEQEKRRKNISTLEHRVAYCKKHGITYGELQRRIYFDKSLWFYFYG